jgi:hypothetical protein
MINAVFGRDNDINGKNIIGISFADVNSIFKKSTTLMNSEIKAYFESDVIETNDDSTGSYEMYTILEFNETINLNKFGIPEI